MNRNMFSSHLFVQLMVTPSLVTVSLASALVHLSVFVSGHLHSDREIFHRKLNIRLVSTEKAQFPYLVNTER